MTRIKSRVHALLHPCLSVFICGSQFGLAGTHGKMDVADGGSFAFAAGHDYNHRGLLSTANRELPTPMKLGMLGMWHTHADGIVRQVAEHPEEFTLVGFHDPDPQVVANRRK